MSMCGFGGFRPCVASRVKWMPWNVDHWIVDQTLLDFANPNLPNHGYFLYLGRARMTRSDAARALDHICCSCTDPPRSSTWTWSQAMAMSCGGVSRGADLAGLPRVRTV